ncbi:MAG TPA: hypothetical protein VGD31_15540, partial [Sphingobacteriaceae bacterium]
VIAVDFLKHHDRRSGLFQRGNGEQTLDRLHFEQGGGNSLRSRSVPRDLFEDTLYKIVRHVFE